MRKSSQKVLKENFYNLINVCTMYPFYCTANEFSVLNILYSTIYLQFMLETTTRERDGKMLIKDNNV